MTHMVLKVAHVYVCNAKNNSGDFILGIATKKYFQEVIVKDECTFTNFDCRNPELYTKENIGKLNEFDHIIVGGGGLFLPDSAPNNVSCWQWVIDKEMYELITSPMYVIAVGYNLFFHQTMNMPRREDDYTESHRLDIFRDNIRALANKTTHFTLRHKQDVRSVLNIIGNEYTSKINYEMCPSVWYVNKYWKPNMPTVQQKAIAIEIKDDRMWRRYYKIGKYTFYNELIKFIKWCQSNNQPVVYLSHDGSKNFYMYLRNNNIHIPILNNSCANEESIKQNYAQIHTILCSAGHSQMMSYGLDINIITLISHPKLRNFCEDVNNVHGIPINDISDMDQGSNLCEIIKKHYIDSTS